MAETFSDVWRKVRLHVPTAGFALAREWTQHAYETLCERRPWHWLRVSTQLIVNPARSLAVGVTQGSHTVTSAGLFTATDAGRQFRVGSAPTYDVDTVVDSSTLTLVSAYTGTTGAATGQILDQYLTLPPDFGAFELVVDLDYQRLVPYWYTQEDLARVDPIRMSSDANPRALASCKLSARQATLGQVQYEWWPAPLSRKALPCYYRKRPGLLADTDPLLGVLANRGRVLELGALARAAAWPGTSQEKNPYFNIALHKQLEDEFDEAMAKLELRDDDMNLDTWSTLPYHRWAAWDLFSDTRYLRASDASVGDYRFSA